MAHKSQLENKKYRNWVKAGLGVKYVKDGLEPFCEHLVAQQHIDILRKVKRKHNLSAVSCGLCDVRTLQPDHVQTKTRQCPLGQIQCNCKHPHGKQSCANKVCSAIYDEIIKLHASTPPAPYWRNTDAQQWCTEPWSVAKCFINAPGYEQQLRADEFDCLGLLHVLINNIEFQQHIKCTISGTDVFSRVRTSRNDIFHSNSMELDDTDVNSYIDDMIELLEDETEIKHRQESKDAVKNLRELKQEDFIISTTDEAEIRREAMAAISEKERELKQTIVDAGNELETKRLEGIHELKGKGLVIQSELEQTGQKINKELVVKDDEIRTTAAKCKLDIEGKGLIMKSELEQAGTKIRKELVMKDDEIRATVAEGERKLVEKGLVIKAEVEQRENKLEQKGMELEKKMTMKKIETEQLEQRLQESKLQLENTKTLIKDSMKNITESKRQAENEHQADNNRKKAEFQEKLVNLYNKYARSVPSIPLQPRKKQIDISDIYVPPLMTKNKQDINTKEWKEVPISMQEIFEDTEMPAKLIYVLGEAGSGKSLFCKMLVHFWCIAHSYPECSLDESDMVKEMERFKYLFYVSLRHYSDCDSIEKMLEKSYHDPALGDILQNESGKCLIVLDGLDEWNPERKPSWQFLTPGLPGRKLDAYYTIITTSRQWKFDALPITEIEVNEKIKIRGIDQKEIENLTEKTVKMLNDIFHKNKSAKICKINLQSRSVSDIHIPLILQQLIFLWFDDKLRDNSRNAIYSSMLAFFLEWNALKSSEYQDCEMITQERSIYPPLPDYLRQFDTFRDNTCVIQYLSYLAYNTLFDKDKETTLTFNNETLERLKIPVDGIKYCLNIGILTEEQNVSLHASICHQSSYSFFHKSMQEYLAAVFIASQFKEMMHKLDGKKRPQPNKLKVYFMTIYNTFLQKKALDPTADCKAHVIKYFGRCDTVVDILEQSNVFIMLCGLEPQLLTSVSEYIYSVVTVDRMVVEERNKVPDLYNLYERHNKLINDIQTCIVGSIDEVISSGKNVYAPVFIADLHVPSSTELLSYYKNIVLENVLSVEVDEPTFGRIYNERVFYLFLERLSKCNQLKAMKVNLYCDPIDRRINTAAAELLVTNVSTLENISYVGGDLKLLSLLISIIPKMRRLVSLKMMMNNFRKVSHDVCLSLSEVLSQTKSIQYISLDLDCEQYDHHILDLSKHEQLKHVDIELSTFYMVNCNTDNLEVCKLTVRDTTIMNQLCNSLYKACKLKWLTLNSLSVIRSCVIGAKTERKTDTENLIRLLPSLVSLSTLSLRHFTLTDNIITCPSDMKNLKEIELYSVTMSMTTWCKFIVGLPALPQSVKVKIYSMYIRDETITEYIMHDEKPEADARQYVRVDANLFRVSRDDTSDFEFTTRKV